MRRDLHFPPFCAPAGCSLSGSTPVVRRLLPGSWLAAPLVVFTCLLAGCGEPARDATGPSSGPGPEPSSEPAGAPNAGRAAEAPGWFTDVTREAGLDFVHSTGARGGLHLPEIMASGVGLLDHDGDGDLDLYLIDAGTGPWEEDRELGELPPVNRLFRRQADGTYVDVTAESGLGDPGYGMGVAVGDVDNDGDVDVYVTNLGPDRLYRNRGDGTFEDVTEAAGVSVEGWSSSAAFCDLDGDGHLDLYVARYVDYDGDVECRDYAGRREYCGPEAFPGQHDVVLRNDGDGTFTDVSEAAGIAGVADAGLGVVCEDFDGDGAPDVYVANDADPNQLWINRGEGTFEDRAVLLGVSVNFQGMPEAGMGVLAADLDRDLDLDLFMTHLRDESNTFYRNLGDAGGTGGSLGFEDASAASGLDLASMPWTGFGTAAFDAELDGDLDLVVVNGRVVRGEVVEPSQAPGAGADLGLPPPPWDAYAEPNLFFLQRPDGRFEPAPRRGRELTAVVEVSRGLATGDLDDDGDVDLVVTNGEGRARIYRNDAPREGHWLTVQALDPRLSREAVGARVVVEAGGARWLRTVQRGFSYLSSSDPRAHFGLGEAGAVDALQVRWPDGLVEAFPGGPADREITLVRGEGRPVPRTERMVPGEGLPPEGVVDEEPG